MPPRASVSRGLLRRLARARQASERENANRMLIEPGRRTLSYGRDSVLTGQHAIALPNRASQRNGDGPFPDGGRVAIASQLCAGREILGTVFKAEVARANINQIARHASVSCSRPKLGSFRS